MKTFFIITGIWYWAAVIVLLFWILVLNVFKRRNMQDDHEDYIDEDFEDEEPEYYYCLGCDWTGDHDPGECPRCSGWSIDAVY